MLNIEEAAACLCEHLKAQTATQTVAIACAYGRVTAMDILAPTDVPLFSKSAMDGYAVFVDEKQGCPADLEVYGELCAGDDPASVYTDRCGCIRIMTGAAIPDPYNAVVKLEHTRRQGDHHIEITIPVHAGENYIRGGGDLQRGDVVIPMHTQLDSEQLNILAALGYAEIEVLGKIRVGLISTGDELVSPGSSVGPGMIYNSTVYSLASYIERHSGTVVFQELCPDNAEAFARLVRSYRDQVDFIITTGGVSVGDKDFLPQGIAALGGEELFHRIAIKPGTPLMASTWESTLILSLSGNPPAALIGFHVFYWQLLAHFFGTPQFLLEKRRARMSRAFPTRSKLPRFIRAYVRDGVIEAPQKDHHYSQIFYNCLVFQPTDHPLALDELVEIYLLPA